MSGWFRKILRWAVIGSIFYVVVKVFGGKLWGIDKTLDKVSSDIGSTINKG